MRNKNIKYLFFIFTILVLGIPQGVFAASCSPDGYTVVYINGIFTPDKKDADSDRDVLRDIFFDATGRKDVNFITGHNESHLGGIGDLIKSLEQSYKMSTEEYLYDYDLENILNQISPLVGTQKILIVGHSQGTFYANYVHNYLATHSVPKESIGVYNVATPAYFVAGGGKHATSSTDEVINKSVKDAQGFFGTNQPLPPNITINLSALSLSTEDKNGHSFSDVYLAGASRRIVSDIADGLGKLTVDENNSADWECFAPPEKNIGYYAKGVMFSVLDPMVSNILMAARQVYGDTKAVTAYITGLFRNVFARGDVDQNQTGLPADIVSALSFNNALNEPEISDTAAPELPVQAQPAVSEPQEPAVIVADSFEANSERAMKIAEIQRQLEALKTQVDEIVRREASGEIVINSDGTITETGIVQVAVVSTSGARGGGSSGGGSSGGGGGGSSGGSSGDGESEEDSEEEMGEESEEDSNEDDDAAPSSQEFQIELSYVPAKLEIDISWTAFADSSAVALFHKIKDEETGEVIFETDSATSFAQRIYEIGREYGYSVHAYDAAGIELAFAEKTITISSLTKKNAFFKGVQYFPGVLQDNFIEFSYDSYPFLPADLVYAPGGIKSTGPNYKVAVLYWNQDAPQHEFLKYHDVHTEDIDNVLQVSVKTCFNDYISYYNSILMADEDSGCVNDGAELTGQAIDYPLYFAEGDNHILLRVRGYIGNDNFFTEFTSDEDYYTMAFYGFYRDDYPSGTPEEEAIQTFKLLAVDNTRHYFQIGAPEREKPTKPGNFSFSPDSFDPVTMLLTVSFDPSTDPDTFDDLIRYQISSDGGASWSDIVSGDKLVVEPNTNYDFQLKAIDDFNIYSDLAVSSFAVPDVPDAPFGITGIEWGYINSLDEANISFNYGNYPFISGSNDYDMMVFYFNRLPPAEYEDDMVSTPGVPGARYTRIGLRYVGCVNGETGDLSGFKNLFLSKVDLTPCSNSAPPEPLSLYPVPAPGESGTISVVASVIWNSPDSTLSKIPIADHIFSSDDYITIGFYNIDDSGNFTTVANDTHRHPFQLQP